MIEQSHGKISWGNGTSFGSRVMMYGPLVIGSDVIISDHVVIGSIAEHRRLDTDWTTEVIIGDKTIIREYVTIHRQVVGYPQTAIGCDCYLMAKSHIAHNCQLEDGVTIGIGSCLCGHVVMLKGSYTGVMSCIHQMVTVGAYAMIGMGAVVVHDVPPGVVVAGNPARIIGPNTVGLTRANVTNLDSYTAEWNERRQGREMVKHR